MGDIKIDMGDIIVLLNPGRLFVIMIYLTRPSLDDLSRGGSYFCVKLPFVIEQMLDGKSGFSWMGFLESSIDKMKQDTFMKF